MNDKVTYTDEEKLRYWIREEYKLESRLEFAKKRIRELEEVRYKNWKSLTVSKLSKHKKKAPK